MGAHWVCHVIENHDDDTGRGEGDEQAYVPVYLLARHGGRGFSCCFGVSGIVRLRFRSSGTGFHELLSWFEVPGDMAGLRLECPLGLEVGGRSSACGCSSQLLFQ